MNRRRGSRRRRTGSAMLRGEIRLVELDPSRGGETDKRRPAVVVSNDRANASATRLRRGVVTVVAVTGNLARAYPFQTLLPAADPGLRLDSRAQAEQIRSVHAERVGPVVGVVAGALMDAVDDALRLHLQL